MDKFTTLEGVAAPLKIINVDTDMIIPKQYLKTIKRTGLGKGLFSEQRYNDDGSENPDFVLNKPAYRNAKVLVAGDNFGCGSSREHAPWALLDFGIRCVISTSFGDIFYNNCFKNGILPIRVSQADLDKLFDDAERGSNATLTIDLASQEIRGPDGGTVKTITDRGRDAWIQGEATAGLSIYLHPSLMESQLSKPHVALYLGTGVLRFGDNVTAINAIPSIHTGFELTMGRYVGIGLTYSLRAGEALGGGLAAGQAAPSDTLPKRIVPLHGIGLILNMSAETFQVFSGESK